MKKSARLVLLLMLAASAAFAGQKIAGARETTVDEPFCAG